MYIIVPITEFFIGSFFREAILQKLFIERANHFCSWIFTAIHGGYSNTKSEKQRTQKMYINEKVQILTLG